MAQLVDRPPRSAHDPLLEEMGKRKEVPLAQELELGIDDER